jgi:hypothetical protein
VLPGSPSPWIIYNSPPLPLPLHCLQSRPLSVARSWTPTGVTLWRSTRPCCLTARGTWFLGLRGAMSSPTSRSSSTSSKRMALLIGTRLVGSSEASLNALGGLQRDLQSRRQACHRPDCADSGCLQGLARAPARHQERFPPRHTLWYRLLLSVRRLR